MYTNIFLFIAAISLFSFSEVSEKNPGSPAELLFALAVCYVFFFLLCKSAFRIKSLSGKTISSVSSGESTSRMAALALFFYSILVFGFNLKGQLLRLPLFQTSSLALSLAGAILPLVLFLIILWYCSFPRYRKATGKSTPFSAYLESNLRLNLSIIFPWLIITLLSDLMGFLPEKLNRALETNYAVSFFLFILVFIAIAFIFPYILVRIWKCPSLPEGAERNILNEFSEKAGIRFSDMVLWNLFDGTMITAGIVGFIRKFRYLLVGPELLNILNKDELESVLAHEIGHIKHRHMFFYLLFIVGYSVFSYGILKTAYYTVLANDLFFNMVFSDPDRTASLLQILSVIAVLLFIFIYFRYVFGYVSRNFERQADVFAFQMKKGAGGLIRSLHKIAMAGNHSTTAPNWHHFSIAQRTDYLLSCEQDPERANMHHRKVTRIKTGYLIFLIFFSALFFTLDSTVLKTAELDLYQKLTEKALAETPNDPALHFALGNIFYRKKEYAQAEKSLLTVVTLAPNHHEALNSLAWLYATAEDPQLKKPADALLFAETAAALAPQPHILDTLAESYYVNGKYAKAVQAIQLAIEKHPQDLKYYQKQKKKFEKALQR